VNKKKRKLLLDYAEAFFYGCQHNVCVGAFNVWQRKQAFYEFIDLLSFLNFAITAASASRAR
jgi:hypothetical protein